MDTSLRLIFNITSILITIIVWGLASEAVIFGEDDRQEVISSPVTNKLSRSVATMIPNTEIVVKTAKVFDLDFVFAMDDNHLGLCKDEMFSDQKIGLVNCTGFLVADDLLITAGHCMDHRLGTIENVKTSYCEHFSWVFDYKVNVSGKVQTENILIDRRMYRCKEVVYREFSSGRLPEKEDEFGGLPPGGEYGNDFAIIRLERKVIGRPFLKLSPLVPKKSEKLMTIGHPSSFPSKSAKGKVLEIKFKNYITTNLDISGGNSGGPVFNKNNEVVGLAVRVGPDEDYILDEKNKCFRNNICKHIGKGNCRPTSKDDIFGTHVQKINFLKILRDKGYL